MIATVILLLNACSSSSEHQSLKICGSFSVPGMFYSDLKGTESDYKKLETDSYGRILFEYSAPNMITNNREAFLVICQKFDNEYVYFYEDICWTDAEYSSTEITRFKMQNDWNKPLITDKMSARRIKTTLDSTIITDSVFDYNTLRAAFADSLDISEGQIKELAFTDSDYHGHQLYWLSTDNSDISGYFVIAGKDYSVEFLEVRNNTVNADELAAFKYRCGWIYGIN